MNENKTRYMQSNIINTLRKSFRLFTLLLVFLFGSNTMFAQATDYIFFTKYTPEGHEEKTYYLIPNSNDANDVTYSNFFSVSCIWTADYALDDRGNTGPNIKPRGINKFLYADTENDEQKGAVGLTSTSNRKGTMFWNRGGKLYSWYRHGGKYGNKYERYSYVYYYYTNTDDIVSRSNASSSTILKPYTIAIPNEITTSTTSITVLKGHQFSISYNVTSGAEVTYNKVQLSSNNSNSVNVGSFSSDDTVVTNTTNNTITLTAGNTPGDVELTIKPCGYDGQPLPSGLSATVTVHVVDNPTSITATEPQSVLVGGNVIEIPYVLKDANGSTEFIHNSVKVLSSSNPDVVPMPVDGTTFTKGIVSLISGSKAGRSMVKIGAYKFEDGNVVACTTDVEVKVVQNPTSITSITPLTIAKGLNFNVTYSLDPSENVYNQVGIAIKSSEPAGVVTLPENVESNGENYIFTGLHASKNGTATLTLTAHVLGGGTISPQEVVVNVEQGADPPTKAMFTPNYAEETFTYTGDGTCYYSLGTNIPDVSPDASNKVTNGQSFSVEGEVTQFTVVRVVDGQLPSAPVTMDIPRYEQPIFTNNYQEDKIDVSNPNTEGEPKIHYTLNNISPTNTSTILSRTEILASEFHDGETMKARVYGTTKFPSLETKYIFDCYGSPVLTDYTPYSGGASGIQGQARVVGDNNSWMYINFTKKAHPTDEELLTPNPYDDQTYDRKVKSGSMVEIGVAEFKVISYNETPANESSKFRSRVQTFDTTSTNYLAIYYKNGETKNYLSVGDDGKLRNVTQFDHSCLWYYDVDHKLYVMVNGQKYYLSSDGYKTLKIDSKDNDHLWVRKGNLLRDRKKQTDGSYLGGYIYFDNSVEVGAKWKLDDGISHDQYSQVCYNVQSVVKPITQIEKASDFVIDSIASAQVNTVEDGMSDRPYRKWVAFDMPNEQYEFSANAKLIYHTNTYPVSRRYYFEATPTDVSEYYYYNRTSYSLYEDVPHESVEKEVSNPRSFTYEWLFEGAGASYFSGTVDQFKYNVVRNDVAVTGGAKEAQLSVKVTYKGVSKLSEHKVSLFVESRSDALKVAGVAANESAFNADRYYTISTMDGAYHIAMQAEHEGEVAKGLCLTKKNTAKNIWKLSVTNESESYYKLTLKGDGNSSMIWQKDMMYVPQHTAVAMNPSDHYNETDKDFLIYPYVGDYFIIRPHQMSLGAINVHNTYSLAPKDFTMAEGQPLRFLNADRSWNKQKITGTTYKYIDTDPKVFEQTRWKLTNPQFEPAIVSMDSDGKVTLKSEIAEALKEGQDLPCVIKYQIIRQDGTDEGWKVYSTTSDISLAEGDKIRTQVLPAGNLSYFTASKVIDEYFVAKKVPLPTLTINQNDNTISFTVDQTIDSITVHYNTSTNVENPEDPTSSSPKYSAPSVEINNGGKLWYRGFATNYLKSDLGKKEDYQAKLLLTDTVSETGVGSNNYTIEMRVKNGAVTLGTDYDIYYTTDGTEPSSEKTKYENGSIQLSGYHRIRAIALPINESPYIKSEIVEVFIGHQLYTIANIPSSGTSTFMGAGADLNNIENVANMGLNTLWIGPKTGAGVFYNPEKNVYLKLDGTAPTLVPTMGEATSLTYEVVESSSNGYSLKNGSNYLVYDKGWKIGSTVSNVAYKVGISEVDTITEHNYDLSTLSLVFDLIQPEPYKENGELERLSMQGNWAALSTGDVFQFEAGMKGTSTVTKKDAYTAYKILNNNDDPIQNQEWGHLKQDGQVVGSNFVNIASYSWTKVVQENQIIPNVTIDWTTSALRNNFTIPNLNNGSILQLTRKNNSVNTLEGKELKVKATYNGTSLEGIGTIYAESDDNFTFEANQVYHIKNLQDQTKYLSVDGVGNVVATTMYDRNAMWKVETAVSVDNGVVYHLRNMANDKLLVHRKVQQDMVYDDNALFLLGAEGNENITNSYNEFLIEGRKGGYQVVSPYELLRGESASVENKQISSRVAFVPTTDNVQYTYTYYGKGPRVIQESRWQIEPMTLVPPTIMMNPSGEITLLEDARCVEWLGVDPNTISFKYVIGEGNPTTTYNVNSKPTLTKGQKIRVLAQSGSLTSAVSEFTAEQTELPSFVEEGGKLKITAKEGESVVYGYNKEDVSWNSEGEGYYIYGGELLSINAKDIYIARAFKQNQLQSELAKYAHEQKLELKLDYTAYTSNVESTELPSITVRLQNTALAGAYQIYWTTDDSKTLENVTTWDSIENGGVVKGNDNFPASTSNYFRAVAVPVGTSSIYTKSDVVSQYVLWGEFSGGTLTTVDGKEGSPYQIKTAGDLMIVASSNNPAYRTGSFIVVNDIDITGCNIPTISAVPNGSGGEVNFSGNWNGNYKKITGGTAPLFDVLSGAKVYNVILENVNVSGNGAIANEANGASRIWNCGVLGATSTVNGTGNVGGICGTLNGTSRVVNCYNYASVSGGTNVGGIVGNVTIASTASNITTLVYNCMNYGDLSGTNVSPIYGGEKTSNVGSKGINNYNYYYADIKLNGTEKYNCALAAEERFLNRFEFYRGILNSNKDKCGYMVNDNWNAMEDSEAIGKWILDAKVAPYPIINKQGKYPSVINGDYAHAQDWNKTEEDRYKGRKMGTLSVKIIDGITEKLAQIPITDMDTNAYDFNYYKIQMPYYQDYFSYPTTYPEKKAKIVTGWEITSVIGGTAGTFSIDAESGYNFADRYCTDKDLYNVSGKVFAQGGYYNVPEGVTAITITAHWANAVYLSDANYDVNYDKNYNKSNTFKNRPTTYKGNTVYNTLKAAVTELPKVTSIYDNAIVLVGNYHSYTGGATDVWNIEGNKYTIMSADDDQDNEPDWCLFHQHTERKIIDPVRFDFLWHPGIGMVAKVDGTTRMPNQGIWRPKGHFEITETCVAHYHEFEYDYSGKADNSPLILNGGIFEQIVSTQKDMDAVHTNYIQLGGHVWMKMFSPGTHADGTNKTKHCPISVMGGEYGSFYLSGMFRPDATVNLDNPHLYANGAKIGHYASGGQEQINGNVVVKVDNIIVNEFYGGGINATNPITRSIDITINHSLVGLYVGGPKFGDMTSGETVTTKADGTIFNEYFGAGYGGSSIYKERKRNDWSKASYEWSTWYNDYTKGAYENGKGVAVGYDYEYFAWAGGSNEQQVGRFYVNYASLSKANTHSVFNTLLNCTVNNDFYGAGFVGVVNGQVTSKLTNTIIKGDAYGAGYSASVPTCDVYDIISKYPSYNGESGVYTLPPLPQPAKYTWTYRNSGNPSIDVNKKLIYTNVKLNDFGKVIKSKASNKAVEFTIDGNSVIYGSVFGGGNSSEVEGDVDLMVTGNTRVKGHVFGGGNTAKVTGNTKVNIGGNR